jgi:hypothetical protein
MEITKMLNDFYDVPFNGMPTLLEEYPLEVIGTGRFVTRHLDDCISNFLLGEGIP